MAYCEEHKPKPKNRPRFYCRHTSILSLDRNGKNLWCDIKCEAHTQRGHFTDGTPCKKFLMCEHPKRQAKCPKFEPKKWWQFWIDKCPKDRKEDLPGGD